MERSFVGDLRFAARTLRRSPAFLVTAAVTIALGIGATTAIFSVVDTVLLRSLPYRDAGRLVLVQSDLTARDVKDFPLPPADFADFRDQATAFEAVAAVATNRQALVAEGGEPERIAVAAATPGLFGLLGVTTVLGRGFLESDGVPLPPPPDLPAGVQPPPPPPGIAVLSHEFWRRRFGGDPAVIGRVLRLGGGTVEVVGVLAPGAELLLPPRLNVERRPDAWIALRIDFATASRINVFLRFVGRLRPGVSVAQAQRQVDGIVADLRRRFPIKETAGVRWRVEPMGDYLVADVKPGVLALMGAVTFVLLIACANVANLLLVRAASRERELVVRAALGAGRADLVRQMLAESLVVAAAGGVLGVALALAGTSLLRRLAPASLPRVDQVGISLPVLGFAALAVALAALLFGLVPALRASRLDAGGVLRAASRTAGLARGRVLRSAVVVAEVALSFVLLVGSGLMIRSFAALQRAEPGYDPAGVLTFVVQPALNQPDQRAAFKRELRARLEALPGVTAVTAATPLPLDGGSANARWGTEDAAGDPGRFQQTDVRFVLPGYFAAMGTRLIEGRALTEDDNAPDRQVMVVDRVMAAKAFPGGSAVGRRLLVRVRSNEPEFIEIVGVVDHQRHETLAADGRETIYLADGFLNHGAASRWAVRTAGDPAVLAAAVRGTVAALAPDVPVAELQPMAVLVERAMAPTTFALALIGVFAVVAVLLAAIGLYGVLATAVRQRTAEIGIRMTFGAPTAGIFRLVIGQGLRLSALGVAAGLLTALALTRVMASLLVGVRPTDPATFGAMTLGFLLVAAAASWLPARRAAALDPAVALREE